VVWAGTDWQVHRVGVAEADKALRELPPGLIPQLGRPEATCSTGTRRRGDGCGGVKLDLDTVQFDGEFASLGLTEAPSTACEGVAERCSLTEAGRGATAPDEADEASIFAVLRGVLLPKLPLGSQQLCAGVPAPLLLPSVAVSNMLLESVSKDATWAVVGTGIVEATALVGLSTMDTVDVVGSVLCMFLMCCSNAATLSCCWRPKVVAFSS